MTPSRRASATHSPTSPSKPAASPAAWRAVIAAALALALTALTGCSDGRNDTDGASTGGNGGNGGNGAATVTAPTALGAEGPEDGDCFTYTEAKTTTAETSVPCTVEHTAEVTDVLTLPDGIDADTPAGRKRIDDLTDEECPNMYAYIGYRGVLTGALWPSWAAPSKEARDDGARWVACTLATYTSPEDEQGEPMLQSREKPLKGALRDDAALSAAGTACRPAPTTGPTIACDESADGQWLALAYRTNPEPFVSAQHQENYARSFCNAAATAYGKPDQRWQAFWSTKPTEDYGHNCLIPLADFNTDAESTLGQSQNDFASPTEENFAAYLRAAGDRLATEDALMGVAEQSRRTSRDYFSREVQDRTVCAVLACGAGSSTTVTTSGNTTAFSVAAPFEDEICRGTVAFPLPYLGAPFTSRDVDCE